MRLKRGPLTANSFYLLTLLDAMNDLRNYALMLIRKEKNALYIYSPLLKYHMT